MTDANTMNAQASAEDEQDVGDAIRAKHADATDREVALFNFLWRAYPYVPATTINLETGESFRGEVNEFLEREYGWRLSEPRKRSRSVAP